MCGKGLNRGGLVGLRLCVHHLYLLILHSNADLNGNVVRPRVERLRSDLKLVPCVYRCIPRGCGVHVQQLCHPRLRGGRKVATEVFVAARQNLVTSLVVLVDVAWHYHNDELVDIVPPWSLSRPSIALYWCPIWFQTNLLRSVAVAARRRELLYVL